MRTYENGLSSHFRNDNWTQIQSACNRHGFQLPSQIVSAVMLEKHGAAVELLELLYEHLSGKKLLRKEEVRHLFLSVHLHAPPVFCGRPLYIWGKFRLQTKAMQQTRVMQKKFKLIHCLEILVGEQSNHLGLRPRNQHSATWLPKTSKMVLRSVRSLLGRSGNQESKQHFLIRPFLFHSCPELAFAQRTLASPPECRCPARLRQIVHILEDTECIGVCNCKFQDLLGLTGAVSCVGLCTAPAILEEIAQSFIENQSRVMLELGFRSSCSMCYISPKKCSLGLRSKAP